ncbi:MAG: rRNA maturation RNase YbeY [Anaerolineales bacterium]|nr:rRNA maturation RNase YbeY [Anaerolineales bacterium]
MKRKNPIQESMMVMSRLEKSGSETEVQVISIVVPEKFRQLISDQYLLASVEKTLLVDGAIDSPSLTLKITDDEEMTKLNQQYRGINKTTDVLSFEGDFIDPDLDSRYLGDVIISFPQAEKQAQRRGHAADAELQLLAVHGILHLLGYDHGTRTGKEVMWEIQSRILETLGLDIKVEDE